MAKETIAGLPRLREEQEQALKESEIEHQAEEDRKAFLARERLVDRKLSAAELGLKYDRDGRWGEYPGIDAASWRYDVSNGYTRLGYWSWVSARLLED